jgi:hypothetical protein
LHFGPVCGHRHLSACGVAWFRWPSSEPAPHPASTSTRLRTSRCDTHAIVLWLLFGTQQCCDSNMNAAAWQSPPCARHDVGDEAVMLLSTVFDFVHCVDSSSLFSGILGCGVCGSLNKFSAQLGHFVLCSRTLTARTEYGVLLVAHALAKHAPWKKHEPNSTSHARELLDSPVVKGIGQDTSPPSSAWAGT